MAENQMTHSQKILVKILLCALAVSLTFGLVCMVLDSMEKYNLERVPFSIAGIAGIITILTFIAFLVSLARSKN